MQDEYQRGLQVPGTPIKTFRLRVFLFPALDEPFTPEEIADGEQFFSRSRYESATRCYAVGTSCATLIVLPIAESTPRISLTVRMSVCAVRTSYTM